ncbi:MAG: sterol desaturase/sphingolipid hydroxylase (fatty acid hydroxylase superfamily) [Verrucomicrobiales bacterium]
MSDYFEIIKQAYWDAGYFFQMFHQPSWTNYLYWLVGISLAFFLLELARPWRKNQPKFRKDFWLDAFYMLFNYFLFALIIFSAVSAVVSALFSDLLGMFGMENVVAIRIETWPAWAQLLTVFILRDFIHWNIHRLLHRVPRLWEFHKVHHSVEQMGFAAHLRFHWIENVVYKTLEFLPLAVIGFSTDSIAIVYLVTLAWGHFNHANFVLPNFLRRIFRPLRYVFNHPEMHIWHHAREMPAEHRNGMNFGLTLSIWDWIFRTAYIPGDGRDLDIGISDQKTFPKTFWGQLFFGFRKRGKRSP